ncbi:MULTISPECIES: DUF2911 domain-containing protein [unclassified Imperialibacter]|uniref:DUF2911 domain-containing protein n=1 Tax=unclassified Imperialibacter TaxID=2629706 RepID=UPI00125855CD|nr:MULTISPECIES: DUF2911 domain-containing protein [unclassified Imperialibacter]CAD5278181.1 conserved exported hypothetical protein [Imperialibacter sp. 75]CAD5295935.1 conserved exported hypothetical protein [Imperialibacter sp. 89]VVT11642.1 conserved exported hypothetical protein [Imperialibacter sp. EC-SDR9]
MNNSTRKLGLSTALAFLCVTGLLAQGITLPPSGDNQKSIVTQYIGSIASVTIDYNSPDVTAPNGADRKGKIWGQLEPYGMNYLGFGTATASPWRAGANQNTTITFSHDMEVEGKAIKAGTYGLHMIIEKDKPWTLILSNNSTAWGSYFYDAKDDALRVEVQPREAPYHEWLSYEFIDRQPEFTVAALYWDELMVPFKISVPNMNDLYLAKIRNEMENAPGFNWQNRVAAVQFCLSKNINLQEALTWAEAASTNSFIGEENFTTLSTKAGVLTALGKKEEAAGIMDKAINHPTASVFQVHAYGRQLIAQGEKQKALEVFQFNANKNPKTWPVNFGLARGYSAVGNYKSALKYAKLALENAPDQPNKDALVAGIAKLEKGEDIN